jgi:hypothetical protein
MSRSAGRRSRPGSTASTPFRRRARGR